MTYSENNSTAIRVSVIVPMRNARPWIAQALRSVLLENNVPIEVLVVDDLSTDHSLDEVLAIGDARVKVIQGEGLGVSAALNKALSSAQGDIVMRCDADDQFPSGRIKGQVDWLDENPYFVAVSGSFLNLDSSGRLLPDLPTGEAETEITEELSTGKIRTSLCTYAVRRAHALQIGGFRTFFETAEDIDFQFRLSEIGRVMYLPIVVYHYRIHDTSITHTQTNSRRNFFEETAHVFQRQRLKNELDLLQQGCPPVAPACSIGSSRSATEHIEGVLIGSAWNAHQAGNKALAIEHGLRALRRRPKSIALWRSVLALILKPVGRKSGR